VVQQVAHPGLLGSVPVTVTGCKLHAAACNHFESDNMYQTLYHDPLPIASANPIFQKPFGRFNFNRLNSKGYQTTETNTYGTAILPKIHFKTCPAKASIDSIKTKRK